MDSFQGKEADVVLFSAVRLPLASGLHSLPVCIEANQLTILLRRDIIDSIETFRFSLERFGETSLDTAHVDG